MWALLSLGAELCPLLDHSWRGGHSLEHSAGVPGPLTPSAKRQLLNAHYSKDGTRSPRGSKVLESQASALSVSYRHPGEPALRGQCLAKRPNSCTGPYGSKEGRMNYPQSHTASWETWRCPPAAGPPPHPKHLILSLSQYLVSVSQKALIDRHALSWVTVSVVPTTGSSTSPRFLPLAKGQGRWQKLASSSGSPPLGLRRGVPAHPTESPIHGGRVQSQSTRQGCDPGRDTAQGTAVRACL